VRDDCITIALGLAELRVIREKETEYEIMVDVEYRASSAICPHCGKGTLRVHSSRAQIKRDRRLWDKPVYLVLNKRRFRCTGCGKVFTEPDPVFGHRRRTSERFRRYLGQEAIGQPVRHVACKEDVGEALVRRCVTEEARRILGAPQRGLPARILGLDEFSIKKRQVYDTAVVDLEKKRVLGVVSGHRKSEVADFFTHMPEPDGVRVVVMDMHEPYRQAVELCLPRANVVVDKFHVLMHIHRALDQVRSGLQPQRGKKGDLFRARYLLLTASERLTEGQRAQLKELLSRYPVLGHAWRLKEVFRDWYRSTTRIQAEAKLILWEKTIREEGPAPFRRLLPMLRIWRHEILNYFDYPYTNGFLEGKNNRIKVIKRMAYGYRNPANFRQRILLTNGKEAYPKAT
jgi:transposase